MKPSSWLGRLFLLLVLLLVCTSMMLGQSGTTTVFGKVSDASGAVVPGAKVTAKNISTGAARETVTDGTGNYRLASLAPGKYDLKVEMAGFRTATEKQMELLVNTTTEYNFQLQVGAASEVVEVSAAAEKLNTSDASIGNAFSEQQITNLPLEGRNVVGLLSLQPGAVFVPTDYTDNRQGSISGSRGDQTNVTLDGVDVNDPNGYAYSSALRTTLDSTQEFRVTTTNYGADQGRSSAAQVTLVTKGGTNEFHGSAYWYHRNTYFSSNEYFNKNSQLWQYDNGLDNGCKPGESNCQPLLQKHIWGWSFGGPILKNRLFFFLNMENLRQKSESSVERAVPSNSFRNGVLIYQCDNPADCPAATVSGLNGQQFSVPAGYYGLTPAELTGIDPLGIGPSVAVSNYFSPFPAPNAQGRDGFNFAGYRFASPINNGLYTYISRFDLKLDSSGNHLVTWRGNLQDDTLNGTPQWPGAPPRSKTLANNRGLALGYTAVFGPRLVNSFRYGFTRIGGGTAGQLNGPWASLRFFTDYIPQTSTNTRIVPTHNFVDDLTWNRGVHTIQLGANIRFTRVITSTNGNSWPWATANGSWMAGNGATFLPGTECPSEDYDGNPFPNTNTTANCLALPLIADGGISSFADGFTDILGAESQSNTTYNYDRNGNLVPYGEPISRKFATNAWEYYVQDNWRVKSNLNLVLGLRWSLNSPPWEVNGNQVAPTFDMGRWFEARMRMMQAGIPSNQDPLVSFDLAGRVNNAAPLYKYDRNNLAPRLSFSYSPNFDTGIMKKLTGGPGKTVVRGGYSMVYDNMGLALANQIDQVASFGMATNVSSPYQVFTEWSPEIRYVSPTFVPDTYPAAQPGGYPATPGIGRGAIDSGIDNSLVTPYAHMFNLMVGRELPGNMTLEVGYVGRRGRSLETRRDLAMPGNLVDKITGVDYFTAVRQIYQYASSLPRSAPWSSYAGLSGAVPYFENLFPGAAGTYCDGYTWGPWDVASMGPCETTLTMLSASQAMARPFNRSGKTGDWTGALYNADEYCIPACSKFGPFAFFNPQWDALGVIGTVGFSEYHAAQVTLRKRYSNGIDFTFNYTFSKSNDNGSAVERGDFWTEYGAGGYTGILINSFDNRSTWSPSDFDVRHQINSNWTMDLPFGQKKALATNAPGWLNAFIGGWQWNGIFRWSSGFPFSIIDCRSCWPTNWQVQGNAIPIDPNKMPPTGRFPNQVGDISQGPLLPGVFKDPTTAFTDYFHLAWPGEGGVRNYLRGDGYFTVDLGIGKSWSMPWKESHKLKFRWEVFNVTNTPRFDVSSLNMLPDDMNTFGSYSSTMNGCDNAANRCMQGSLRFEF